MLQYKYQLATFSLSENSHDDIEDKLNKYCCGERVVSMTQVGGVFTFLIESTYDSRDLDNA